MTATRPLQNTFSSGELDPLLGERNDFQRFQTGLARSNGFLPLRQGGFTLAPGTIYRGTTRENRRAVRIPFQFAINDSLSLEFTDRAMRVWRYGALVRKAGLIYEIETPYLEADLPNLDYVQDSDVIYIVDGRQPMQRLARKALDDWEIGPAVLTNGPFQVQNLDESKAVQCSAVFGYIENWAANEILDINTRRKFGGNVYYISAGTLNADPITTDIRVGASAPTHTSGSVVFTFSTGESTTNTVTWTFDYSTEISGTVDLISAADVFDADDIGTLFMLRATDYRDVPLWIGNSYMAPAGVVRYGGNIYRLTAGSNTGLTPPVHTSGAVRTDASQATEWTFLSDETGIVRITAVTDARAVTADVLKTIPLPCVDSPTYRWSKAAWSAARGYPARITSWRRRLYLANTPYEPRTLWASTLGLFTDFEPSAEADGAFAYEIDGEGSRNEISWLKGGQRGIYIGALGEVYRGFSAVAGEAIGPRTFDTELVDSDGAAPVRPILPYGFPIYISRDRSRVQETRYSFETDGSKPVELSLPSQHLGNAAFEQIVWQSAPHRRAWIRRRDGTLACMVYDPDQDVLGWAPVPPAGGFVEGIDVTASDDGAFDVLTMIVRRTIDGATVRHVEEQAINVRALLGSDPVTHFNHGWSGVTFAPETATATIPVPHLVGETVWAWTDKGQFGPIIVPPGGDVTLPDAVSRAIVGLRDDNCHAETLNIMAAARDGDTRGRLRRLNGAIGIGLYRTAAGNVRSVEHHFDDGIILNDSVPLVERNVGSDQFDLKTGTRRVDVPSGHADQVRLRFEPVGIAPLTITSITPNIDEAGA